MFKFTSILFLVVALATPCWAQTDTANKTTDGKASAEKKVDEAKRADIVKMLKLTGADKNAMQMIEQMISMQKNANPAVPADFWDKFVKEVNGEDLINLTVPSWEKHYTHDEIKELIKFYQSPIGKKMISVQPMIMQESMMAGQKWGMDIARKIAERLQKADF